MIMLDGDGGVISDDPALTAAEPVQDLHLVIHKGLAEKGFRVIRQISCREDDAGAVEDDALGRHGAVDLLPGPVIALDLTPEGGVPLLTAAEQHKDGVLAALYILQLFPGGFQGASVQGFRALVYAGEDRDDIRPQNIKGVGLIYTGNAERKILLFDLHIVIEHHGKIRAQVFPGPADAQIVAPGKAGVLPV